MKSKLLAIVAVFAIGLGAKAIAECPFGYPRFAPTSFWYQEIPADVTLNPNTSGFQSEFTRQITAFGMINLDIRDYSSTVWVAAPDTPTVNVTEFDCAHTGYYDPNLQTQFNNVPIPDYAIAAGGTDGDFAVWQPSTDTYWEMWQMQKDVNGNWQACWGGKLTNVSQSDGLFPKGYGQTATSLPIAPGQITVEELRTGEINHVIGISMQVNKAGTFYWPAQRTDGTSNLANALPEGIRFRIDPTLNLDSLNLSPIGRAIAKAGQKYGFVVWDTAGSVAIRLENPYRYEKEGWPTTIYSTLRSQLGVTSGHEMDNFPTTHMQFMPVDYGNPAYSSWTPADLGSNKTIWLDASASASIAQSGGALSQWCDPSETAGACSLVNGTQATPAQRPSVSSSIVGFASSSSQTLNLSASITGASTYTCWAVVKAPSFTRASLLGNSSATSSYPFTLINGGIAIASANGYASAGSWPDYTNYHVINSSSNNASSTSGFDLWVDGTRQPITAYNASPRGSTWDAIGIINGSLYSDIYVQEMFCSSAVESDETKASGRAYLRQKWGTP